MAAREIRAPSGPVPAVSLPRSIADEIVAHASAEAPIEACGLVIGSDVAARGGSALRYVACRNRLAGRSIYEIHPDDLAAAVYAADDAGEEVWGIVHSHVTVAAVPSTTDIGRAAWPQAVQVLVSLAGAEPALRAWWIRDGSAVEVELLLE
jgi:proteasome lid subunit RPN8/RPN11